MSFSFRTFAREIFIRLPLLFQRGHYWTTVVGRHKASAGPTAMGERLFIPFKPGFRKRLNTLNTMADPFLFVHGEALYLFAEQMTFLGHGEIVGFRTKDLSTWESLGVVLREGHHLSYPNVFSYEGKVYMLPEGGASGRVTLYQPANSTPGPDLSRWVPLKTLLVGDYYDPTLLFLESGVYLFVTHQQRGLCLFHATHLFGDFQEHSSSPITRDHRYARCAGPILQTPEGERFRLSQDGTRTYGEDIFLNRILQITPESCLEELGGSPAPRVSGVIRPQVCGMHHLSTAHFQGADILALDFKELEPLVNHLVRPFWQTLKVLRDCCGKSQ